MLQNVGIALRTAKRLQEGVTPEGFNDLRLRFLLLELRN